MESGRVDANAPNVESEAVPLAHVASSPSTCLIRIRGSTPTTLWGSPTCLTAADTNTIDCTSPDLSPQTRLQLQPNDSVVVGRQNGGPLEYLDPAFQPTRIEPTGGQPVLRGIERDICVSRGHFMLRGSAAGILLVNGVPRRGGGIRPPLNGTRLVSPIRRRLEPAEEYLIERGCSATFQLPNGTEIFLHAE